MRSLKRADFLQQSTNMQISLQSLKPANVEALRSGGSSPEDLRLADLNGDGFVRGEQEWGALFDALESRDAKPGNQRLETASVDGGTLEPAGKTLSVLNAMMQPEVPVSGDSADTPIRARRPHHVRLNAGLPSGLGVGYTHNLNPNLALEVDAGTLAILNDVSAGVTWMTSDGNFTPTLSARYHWLSSNFPFGGGAKNTHTLGVRAGVEYTADNGFTAGAYLGAMTPVATDGSNTPRVMPDGGIHLGFRW